MTQTQPDTLDNPRPDDPRVNDPWLARSRETVARIDLAPEAETVGRVERVGDGIALVSGLPDACLSELLRFDGGRMGFALTLDTDTIGAVLLDDGEAIEAGSRVTGTGEVVRVPVGPGLLGRIVDPLGRPLDRDEPVKAEARYGTAVLTVTYDQYGDWNDDAKADVYLPKHIVETQNGMTVLDLTITHTNTYNPYVIVPIPANVKGAAGA